MNIAAYTTYNNEAGATFNNYEVVNLEVEGADNSGAVFNNAGTYNDAGTGTTTRVATVLDSYNDETNYFFYLSEFNNTGLVNIASGDIFKNYGLYTDNAGVNSTDSTYFTGTTISAGGTFYNYSSGPNNITPATDTTAYSVTPGNGGVIVDTWNIFTNNGTFIDDSCSNSYNCGIGLNTARNSDFYNYGTVTVEKDATSEIGGYYYDNNGSAADNYIGTTIESGGTLTINAAPQNGGTLFINDDIYVYGTVNNLYTNNVVISPTNGIIVGSGGAWNGYS
jgi:hypothetical protein